MYDYRTGFRCRSCFCLRMRYLKRDLPQNFNVERCSLYRIKLLNMALAHQTSCEWIAGNGIVVRLKQNEKASGYPSKPRSAYTANAMEPHRHRYSGKFFVERRWCFRRFL